MGKKCVQAVCSVGKLLCKSASFAQLRCSAGNIVHSVRRLYEFATVQFTQLKELDLIWNVHSFTHYPHNLRLLLFIYNKETRGSFIEICANKTSLLLHCTQTSFYQNLFPDYNKEDKGWS
jgi:hypothetical protein